MQHSFRPTTLAKLGALAFTLAGLVLLALVIKQGSWHQELGLSDIFSLVCGLALLANWREIDLSIDPASNFVRQRQKFLWSPETIRECPTSDIRYFMTTGNHAAMSIILVCKNAVTYAVTGTHTNNADNKLTLRALVGQIRTLGYRVDIDPKAAKAFELETL